MQQAYQSKDTINTAIPIQDYLVPDSEWEDQSPSEVLACPFLENHEVWFLAERFEDPMDSDDAIKSFVRCIDRANLAPFHNCEVNAVQVSQRIRT